MEVKNAFPDGLDGRHVAWIWRRVLNIIGFAHSNGIIHGAVLPMHILIEPNTHKLLLVDWCCATRERHPLPIIAAGYAAWYKRDRAATNHADRRRWILPSPGPAVLRRSNCWAAIRFAVEFPGNGRAGPSAPLFKRASSGGVVERRTPGKLLADFRSVDGKAAWWGPRKFQVLTLPPKDASA